MRNLIRLMSFMIILAILAGLLSCSSDGGDGGSESSSLSPYLPAEFSGKSIDAFYVKSESGDYPSEGVRNYSGTYTYYFFSDHTWIMTVAAEWTQNGQKMTPKFKIYEGTFTKTGTYTNGTIQCNTTETNNPQLFCMPMPQAPTTLNVSAGKFTIQSYTFEKQ